MSSQRVAVVASAPRLARPSVARTRRDVWLAGAVCFLFLLAFVPRTVLIQPFVTPDEDNWMRRIGNFARAVERGQLRQTYQSGHPGVTTMWVGWVALGSEASRLAGQTGPDPIVTVLPGFMELLARARFVFAAVNAALVVIITLLTLRLFGPGTAGLAGGLLAFEPFLIAHSQVVHLDALATQLMTVAVLAAVIFWWGGAHDPAPTARGYLILCGVASGLAVLTKAPSLFLGLFLPLVAVGGHLFRSGGKRCWRSLVASLAGCGAVALGTIFVLWPALWVEPIETLRRAVDYTLLQARTPHGPGNFFQGRPTADLGPFYYPIAVAFRTTPTVVVGLAALAVVLPPPAARRQALILLAYLAGFLAFVTLASKKLDRYALPMMPTLSILAALGLSLFWPQARLRLGRWLALAAVVLVTASQAIWLATALPYPLAFYNPLVGGGAAARSTLLVGWGEGLDRAAAFLNAQPDAASATIGIYYPLVRNFQAVTIGHVQRYGDPGPASYAVDYVSAAQRGQTPPELVGLVPEFTVRVNDIVYAQVYRLSPPRAISPAPLRAPPERGQPVQIDRDPDSED